MILGLLWAVAASIYILTSLPVIASMTMPDPDDYLRLQQVRDWLGGQAWYDVTQHRINPPAGGEMHWTRIVDLPLAAGIGVLTPFVGAHLAEQITATAVPLIILGLIMWLIAMIAARLVGRAWAPVAAMTAPLSGLISPQIMPLRIDHHGWQIVLALVIVWALMDEARKRRAGVIAGVAAAAWLNISLEGLPITATVAALLGVRWLLDARELPRLQAFLWALAASSFLLESATVQNAWAAIECDRLSRPYMLTLVVGALAGGAASWPALARDWRARLAFGCAAGVAVALTFASAGAVCLGGPFGNLEPLARTLWLEKVGESLPLVTLGFGAIVAGAGFAALGIGGAAWAARRAEDAEMRWRWISVLAISVVATVLMLMVTRMGGVAHTFVAFGAVYLARAAFVRARALTNVALRALATAVALIIATPAFLLPAAAMDKRPSARVVQLSCGDFTALNVLPPSLLYAELDIGPKLIVRTRHSVIGTGHHRNHAAINEVITAFTGTPDAARALITARGAPYVVLCRSAPETRLYARYAPDGFAAQLVGGETPDWLEQVPSSPGLLVYRVREVEQTDIRGRAALDQLQLRLASVSFAR